MLESVNMEIVKFRNKISSNSIHDREDKPHAESVNTVDVLACIYGVYQ